jgi:hypothetical protein
MLGHKEVKETTILLLWMTDDMALNRRQYSSITRDRYVSNPEKSEPCLVAKRGKATIILPSWRMGNVAFHCRDLPAITGNKGERSITARTVSSSWP